jgi:hypothetical protein
VQHDAGELLAHGVDQERAVRGQVPAHLVEPGLAVPPRGLERLDAEHADPAPDVARQRAEPALQLVAAEDRDAAAQPRDVERLRRGGQRDRARLDLGRQRRERHVPEAGMEQILMDLVGHHDPVALDRERRERLELFAAERASTRIVRIAQQQHARARVGAAAQLLEIDRIAALAQRERILVEAPALLLHAAEERRIDRRLHDDAVAGLGELVHRDVHPLHDVGQHLDARGIDGPAVQALHALRGELGDRRRCGMDRIADVRSLDREPQHAADRLRDREVHVGDPQRQHVVAIGGPLLAAARAPRRCAHAVEIGGWIAQRALDRVERAPELVTGQRCDRMPRAREQSREVAPQFGERPRERVEAVGERRDVIAALGIEVPVTAAREAVEAQPLAAAAIAHAQRRTAVGPRTAVLDLEHERSDGKDRHGCAL